MSIIPVDLVTFHQKLHRYPATYLLPDEEKAIISILNTLGYLSGPAITQLSRSTQLQVVKAIV